MTDVPDIFDLFNKKSTAYIYDCYDGDTCKAILTIPNTDIKIKMTCRMDGYDSAEVRTRCANEKKLGIISRDRLRDIILEKEVSLIGYGKDKYGRLLVRLSTDEYDDINQYMIDNNLGHPYDGGKKSKIVYNDDNTFVRGGTIFKY